MDKDLGLAEICDEFASTYDANRARFDNRPYLPMRPNRSREVKNLMAIKNL